jgi:hypothetical protein
MNNFTKYSAALVAVFGIELSAMDQSPAQNVTSSIKELTPIKFEESNIPTPLNVDSAQFALIRSNLTSAKQFTGPWMFMTTSSNIDLKIEKIGHVNKSQLLITAGEQSKALFSEKSYKNFEYKEHDTEKGGKFPSIIAKYEGGGLVFVSDIIHLKHQYVENKSQSFPDQKLNTPVALTVKSKEFLCIGSNIANTFPYNGSYQFLDHADRWYQVSADINQGFVANKFINLGQSLVSVKNYVNRSSENIKDYPFRVFGNFFNIAERNEQNRQKDIQDQQIDNFTMSKSSEEGEIRVSIYDRVGSLTSLKGTQLVLKSVYLKAQQKEQNHQE